MRERKVSVEPMRVAIAGAGLAGLASAWHLLSLGVAVDLYDPLGVGGGASGISTGLLHPFPGKRALPSLEWEEGMRESEALLQVAEEALGRLVADYRGVFRPAITEQQTIDFRRSGAEWRTVDLPGIGRYEGLWIAKGKTVYSRLYLEGIWRACASRGARIYQAPLQIESLDRRYDATVLALGSAIRSVPFYPGLNLKEVIGQTLLCKTDRPPPFALVSQGHITPTEQEGIVQVGSTYEHTPSPDPAQALALLEKVSLFYPPAKEFEVLEVRSGIRMATREGYLPLIKKEGEKLWVLSGLGSRGMLYHASFGKKLAKRIAETA